MKTLPVLLLMISLPVFGEQKPEISVSGDIGLSDGIGYMDPSLGISSEAKLVLGRIGLVGGGSFAPVDRKIETGDGRSFGGFVSVRLYLSESLFAGPVVSKVRLETSKWSKEATYVGGIFGFDGDKTDFFFKVSRDLESINKSISASGTVRIYFPLSGNEQWGLVISPSFGLLWFHQQRQQGWQIERGEYCDFSVGIYKRF